jgi:hypothetical protein
MYCLVHLEKNEHSITYIEIAKESISLCVGKCTQERERERFAIFCAWWQVHSLVEACSIKLRWLLTLAVVECQLYSGRFAVSVNSLKFCGQKGWMDNNACFLHRFRNMDPILRLLHLQLQRWRCSGIVKVDVNILILKTHQATRSVIKILQIVGFHTEANPTIMTYNASPVKSYSTTSSLVRFKDKIFFYFEKRCRLLHTKYHNSLNTDGNLFLLFLKIYFLLLWKTL